MPIKRFNKPSFHIAFLIFITFMVYAHTFDAGFVFDDYAQQEMLKLITSNQREMNLFSFIRAPEEATYYTQMTAVPWWTNTNWRIRYLRPVATLSHLFDYTLWGSNPVPYHVHNVILYALLVVLLYVFYRALCKHDLTAFCGALVFALQPCHYMTVRWPASRNDIICATFLVVSFICYVRFHEKKKPLFSILFFCSYILALLTKEIAFIFPVFFFTYDWIRFKKLKDLISSRWKVYLTLCIINCCYYLFYQVYGYGSYWYGERVLQDYPLDFLKAATTYLCSLFYGGVFASAGPDFLARYWALVAVLLLIVGYLVTRIWKQKDRFPEIRLCTLWIMLPLPFIVVPPLNDRLLIIPSIGFAYLAALAIVQFGKKGLALFFLVTALMLPPITNVIQAREHDKVLQTTYEHFHTALNKIIPHKTSRDKLFILNFPAVGMPELGLSGENYMYLALYFDLYYQYPEWQVPHYPLSAFDNNLSAAVLHVKEAGMKVYPLSPFDGAVTVQIIDDHHLRISHPTRYFFETNTEKLFSLNRTFVKGETFHLPDVTITLDEMEGDGVKSIVVAFVEPLDNPRYYFLFYDKGTWQRWHPLKGVDIFTNT
jgi:hypothetical protein